MINLSQRTDLDSNLVPLRKPGKGTFINKLQLRPSLPLGYPEHSSKKAQQSACKVVGSGQSGGTSRLSYMRSFKLPFSEPFVCEGNLLGIQVTNVVKIGI